MMHAQLERTIDCPWCGEAIVILLDPSVPRQSYVEDCAVCCQPIVLDVEVLDEDEIVVTARAESR